MMGIITTVDMRKQYQKVLEIWKTKYPDKTLEEIKKIEDAEWEKKFKDSEEIVGEEKQKLLNDYNGTIGKILKDNRLIDMDNAIALFSKDEEECKSVTGQTYAEQKTWLIERIKNPVGPKVEVTVGALSQELQDLNSVNGGLEKCTENLNKAGLSTTAETDKKQSIEAAKNQLKAAQKLIEKQTSPDAVAAKAAITEALKVLETPPLKVTVEQQAEIPQQQEQSPLVSASNIGEAKKKIEEAKTKVAELLKAAQAKETDKAKEDAAVNNKKLVQLLNSCRKTQITVFSDEDIKSGKKEDVTAFVDGIPQRVTQGMVNNVEKSRKQYMRDKRFYAYNVSDSGTEGEGRKKKKKSYGELIKELEDNKFTKIPGEYGTDGFLYYSHIQEDGEDVLVFAMAYSSSEGLKNCLEGMRKKLEEFPNIERRATFDSTDDRKEKMEWALENGIECRFGEEKDGFFKKALADITGADPVGAILSIRGGQTVSWIPSTAKTAQKFFVEHYFANSKHTEEKNRLFDQLLKMQILEPGFALGAKEVKDDEAVEKQDKQKKLDEFKKKNKNGLEMENLLAKADPPLFDEYKKYLKNGEAKQTLAEIMQDMEKEAKIEQKKQEAKPAQDKKQPILMKPMSY